MAQNEIRVLSDLSLVGSLNFSTNFADFPANPSPRTMVVVKGVTYIYTELLYNSGYYSWQPVGVKQASHLHTQGVPSTVWTVTHNFNSTDFAYFVYDTNHNMMLANIEIVDSNTVRIMLSTATAGTAVFFSIEYVSAQAINAAASVGIGSLTLRDATGTLTVNNNPVAMAQAVSDAFASVYTKPQTDSAISAAVGVEAAARVLGDADTLAAANSFTIEQLMVVVGDVTATATTAATSSSEYTDIKVAEEASRATAAESALGSRIDSVISNTDPVALNSLSEVVTAFQSANGDITAAIAALGTNASSVLASEIARAEAAESKLTSDLATETAARTSADAINANAIATETSARATAITAESIVRSNAITAEIARATAAEGVLTANLASEVTARTSGDTASVATAKGYTDNAIANEVTARNSAINAEAARATAAESALASSLVNEVTSRTTADAATLASAKTYADNTGASALSSANTYTNSAISAEVTARNLAIANSVPASVTKLTTARTINGVSFDGTANISFGTDSVVEGTTNKYYTDARARAAISAGTGIAYSSATGVISSAITQYTDALARAAISVTGSGSYNSTTGVITVTGGVTSVSGKTGAVVLTAADVSGAAPLASPALTGIPTAPTAAAGTTTGQIATTAFVTNSIIGSKTYATWNSADASGSTVLSGDLLTATLNNQTSSCRSTVGISTGIAYWEITNTTGTAAEVGISLAGSALGDLTLSTNAVMYFANGTVYARSSTPRTYGATFTVGDKIGVLLNMTAGTVTFYKNGVSQGVAYTGLTGTWHAAVGNGTAASPHSLTANFGVSTFAYTVPPGALSGLYAVVASIGVSSFNSRTGAIVLAASDVTAALGFTPVNATGSVTSVAGRAGAVVLTVADVSGAAPQATTYTKAEVDAAIAAAITAFAATLYV